MNVLVLSRRRVGHLATLSEGVVGSGRGFDWMLLARKHVGGYDWKRCLGREMLYSLLADVTRFLSMVCLIACLVSIYT